MEEIKEDIFELDFSGFNQMHRIFFFGAAPARKAMLEAGEIEIFTFSMEMFKLPLSLLFTLATCMAAFTSVLHRLKRLRQKEQCESRTRR